MLITPFLEERGTEVNSAPLSQLLEEVTLLEKPAKLLGNPQPTSNKTGSSSAAL